MPKSAWVCYFVGTPGNEKGLGSTQAFEFEALSPDQLAVSCGNLWVSGFWIQVGLSWTVPRW